MRRLILFDVDGTLLLAGPQVRPAFLGALRAVLALDGELDDDGFDYAGKTDGQITFELLRAHGHGGDDGDVHARLEAIRDHYAEALEASLEASSMQLLPGVVELLDALAARDDVAVGLLTGNWRRGAEIKLGRLGLWPRFPFGAFGDDALDRRALVPVALERAHRHAGRPFRPEETLIVGDTVRDVDCARAAGVPALTVTTGRHSAAMLEEAGADWVFADLRAAAEVILG